jgi:hypothetical protein
MHVSTQLSTCDGSPFVSHSQIAVHKSRLACSGDTSHAAARRTINDTTTSRIEKIVPRRVGSEQLF